MLMSTSPPFLPHHVDPAPLSVPDALTPEEQNLVDGARDILMRQRNLSPEQAVALLTEIAEKRRTNLASVAAQLLRMSSMLTV